MNTIINNKEMSAAQRSEGSARYKRGRCQYISDCSGMKRASKMICGRHEILSTICLMLQQLKELFSSIRFCRTIVQCNWRLHILVGIRTVRSDPESKHKRGLGLLRLKEAIGQSLRSPALCSTVPQTFLMVRCRRQDPHIRTPKNGNGFHFYR